MSNNSFFFFFFSLLIAPMGGCPSPWAGGAYPRAGHADDQWRLQKFFFKVFNTKLEYNITKKKIIIIHESYGIEEFGLLL
jgi:hypothetical protein